MAHVLSSVQRFSGDRESAAREPSGSSGKIIACGDLPDKMAETPAAAECFRLVFSGVRRQGFILHASNSTMLKSLFFCYNKIQCFIVIVRCDY